MRVIVKHPFLSLTARILCLLILLTGFIAGGWSYYTANLYKKADFKNELASDLNIREVEPFPVSVFPREKVIREYTDINLFLHDNLAIAPEESLRTSWRKKVVRKFSQSGLFQQLATPGSRVIVIWSGERKEEVIKNIASILDWDKADQEVFTEQIELLFPSSEGALFPGNYIVSSNATPHAVARSISERFNSEILARYPDSIERNVPLTDALIVASLIEREAYSFEHMRIISGVIWKRIFIDMPLQLDATLQYAKAPDSKGNWWPVPKSKDKYLDSPFNTYKHQGLPPAPISSPGVAALLAALNPIESDCLFYFHDDDGEIYCSPDYGTHVTKLKEIFGQGR